MRDKLPCVTLDYENELKKAQTSSESKEHYELSDGEASTIGIVIYYLRSQKFESEKNIMKLFHPLCTRKCLAFFFLCCHVCLMNVQITISCIILGQNASITTEIMPQINEVQIQNHLQ